MEDLVTSRVTEPEKYIALCVEETLGKGMTSVVRRRGDTKLLMEKLKHNYKLPTMIECNAKHLLFFIHKSFSRFVLCFVYANHSY